MLVKSFGYSVAFLAFHVLSNVLSTPVLEYDKGLRYEEYVIEHEISAGQAKNSVLIMDSNKVSQPPGCQSCSLEERRYCLSTDMINDHCCCDRRHLEVLPYIPHTCYFGTQLCTPVALDCTEYRRLRTCCCDKLLLEKWTEKLGDKSVAARIILSVHSLAWVILIGHLVQNIA